MNQRHQQTETLVDEKDALSLYFEALLREEVVEAPAVEADVRADQATPAAEMPPQVEPVPVIETPPVATPEPEVSTPAVAAEPVVPRWGEGSFQAMLFRVGGLTLAVPLVELSGVLEWDSEAVTAMPGHTPWYLGLMDYRGRSVPVVDTALLVLPEERLARLDATAEQRLRRVVFIGEGEWGLACDEVNQVVALAPDQVRWRTNRTRRQWLAGTVIDHMCAIIDPPAFARMLATGMEDAEDADGADGDSTPSVV